MQRFISRLTGDIQLQKADRILRKMSMDCEDTEYRSSIKHVRRIIRQHRKKERKRVLMLAGLLCIGILFFFIWSGICLVRGFMKDSQDSVLAKGTQNAKEGENTAGKNSKLEEPVELLLTFTGDCILGTDEFFAWDTGFNAYYEMYGPEYFLDNVRDIFQADDLTIINMEGTLTEETERLDKQFAFKGEPAFVDILASSSVEAANMANNHSHDYGEQSFDDTLAALDDAGIVHFGYDETAVMDVKGIKVGLVGIYELYDHLEREQQLKDNIAKVKADGAQLIVVIFHWGNETETVPDSNQTTLGRIAIDEGADLVCGHHPHVLQGIETYKGRNIVYSLGNFCFGGNSSPSDMDTMIYQQTFTIDADGIKKDNVTNIIPCSISSAAYDGYNNYQPTPAEGDEATRILGKINERSSWISTAEGSTFTAKYNSNNDSQSSSADTAASDSDIVDMNSSASDDTDAETYDESYDTDNSDAE